MKRILFCTLLVLGIQNSPMKISEFVSSTDGNQVEEQEEKELELPKEKTLDTRNFFGLDERSMEAPVPSKNLINTIDKQITILKRRKPFKVKTEFSGLSMSQEELRKTLLKTAKRLRTWSEKGDESTFFEEFELYRVNGFDQKGKVEFTAYYTPIYQVRTIEDTTFRYPIVKILPTKDINTNQRLTKTLWAKNPKTAASVRMQGSAFIQYSNGEKELISYQPQVIESAKLPQGDTATTRNIFVEFYNYPKGSTGVSLTPNYSIAVDPKYIPYGSCLVSEVPVVGKRGKIVRYDRKILFAQDTGGYIKGMHVDYYCGVGSKAEHQAKTMHDYGRMWLILAKDQIEE